MSRNPPQTLSVKRKRNEAPVDSLIVEHNQKRQRSDFLPSTAAPSLDTPANSLTKDGNIVYRRIQVPSSRIQPDITSPTGQGPRRFIIDRSTEKRFLVEARPAESLPSTTSVLEDKSAETGKPAQDVPTVVEPASRPRKRPGPGSALSQTPVKAQPPKAEPAEELIRKLENFSSQVEKEESGVRSPLKSPTKVKPKAPKLRFKDRHPEKAAALAAQDPDAMELDTDEYVYDTYVREIMVPDADGRMPEPQGTVGFIVIKEEDEEWWNGDDESDKEFDTDDEDENAEDYYANDYPEDELSSDDEYGINPYQYRGGNADEEYDLGDEEDESGDEDDAFRQSVPAALPVTAARPGYWGRHGE